MTSVSTRVELRVPEEVAGTLSTLLTTRTGTAPRRLDAHTLRLDLAVFEPDLPDAVGGWLAGMRVTDASVSTGAPGDLRPGWPQTPGIIGGWLHLHSAVGANAPAHAVRVDLDPGLCFGSGWSITSRLCARALDTLLPRSGCLEGKTVLDVGCGAGLFSVALALLGAQVVAIDRWPTAVRQTRLNADAAGVGDRVQVCAAEASGLAGLQFDLIVANLAPAVDLGPVLVPLALDAVALSGLQVTQAQRTLAAYRPLSEWSRRIESPWLALALVRDV